MREEGEGRPGRPRSSGEGTVGWTEARPAELEPCLRCGVPIPRRRMGCRGGHCPNCGHPYPHGDCSD